MGSFLLNGCMMAEAIDLLEVEDREALLRVARASLEQFVRQGSILQLNWGRLSATVQEPGATFVTLRCQGRLRGCIGNVMERRPLAESVTHNTIAAAWRDPRFARVTSQELKDIRVEVTVLTPLHRLLYQDYDDLQKKVRPKVDGVMLIWGSRRGILLPQVWERVKGTADFLKAITLKATIPLAKLKTQPPEVEVFIFQAQHFEERD